MNIIEIQSTFITEARNSPVLLSDLANMEGYIAESYQGRSLIELLQNADDAQSTNFILRKIRPNVYIVANNGRYFSEQDIHSICRSGSSTKRRNSNTIGYRGIGFKSVVNYSKAVHLSSGNVALTFSRALSEKVLYSGVYKVPLIRIPHEFAGTEYAQEIASCREDGYTTIFIFEVTSTELDREIATFEETCLLFLNSIETVTFEAHTGNCKFSIRREHDAERTRITLQSESAQTDWLTIRDTQGTKAALAFLLNDSDVIVPLGSDAAVIHSFMPTQEKFRFKFKINGDFSTDPSRTRVVVDQSSIDAAKRCASIFSELLISLLSGVVKDDLSIISISNGIRVDATANLRIKNINDVFCDAFLADIAKLPQNLGISPTKETVLQPVWMDCIDFESMCASNGIHGLGDANIRHFPKVEQLLISSGLKTLSLEALIAFSATVELSLNTRLEVVRELIQKYRFKMTQEIIAAVRKARLFDLGDGNAKALEGHKNPKLSVQFISQISALVPDEKDFLWFLEKLGVKPDLPATIESKVDDAVAISPLGAHAVYSAFRDKISIGEAPPSAYIFKKTSGLKKWRSVEENVETFFRDLASVKRVLDVSKSNLGYDIEVQSDNGVQYIEIKSVEDLGDPISLTNNEYSTAARQGASYVLAIARQDARSIKICLIQDPVKKMELIKRVTRWEWVCNEYEGDLFERTITDDIRE